VSRDQNHRKPDHVLDRVNGDAAFADFSKDAIRVAVDPIKR